MQALFQIIPEISVYNIAVMKCKGKNFSGITGMILSVCLFVITIVIRKDFFGYYVESGTLLLISQFVMCVLIFLVSFFQWDLKGRKKRIFSVIAFLLAPLLMECAVEICNGNMLWDIELAGNIFMNYLLNLLVYLLFFVITGSMRGSMKISSVILAVFGIANMYVKDFKGGPLLPWDLSSLRTAGNVAGAFRYEIGYQSVMTVTAVILIWKVSSLVMKNPKTKPYRIVRMTGAVFLALFTWVFWGTDTIATAFGATPDFFNQTRGYENKGAFAEFLVNTRYLHLSRPDNYDASKVEKEVTDNTEEYAPTILETDLIHDGRTKEEAKKEVSKTKPSNPNIIVIMNESFSDLSVDGNFQTNEDYMPFINSLRDDPDCIEGNSYVSVLGTGTSNTEYEFLTGNSMAFLPYGSNAYQLYVKNNQPSLVTTLKDQGYSADAFHPYYRVNWNRDNVYQYMNFDSFTSIEGMDHYDTLRLFVSDQSDFEHVEQMYEKRNPDKPFFLFNVTMQNHSSYDQEDPDFRQEITLKNMKGDYPEAEQYLSLVKKTDEAFEQLIAYFRKQKEPTIILMYGDHQPYVEDAFYQEIMGKDLNSLSDEEAQKRYHTRFILWANYDIPHDWIDMISVNYLSVLLSQVAGTQLTPYQQFLNTLYTKVPVVTAMGCRDWNNQYFTVDDENAKYAEILNVYEDAAYNNLMEDTGKAKKLFYIRKKEEDS